MTRSTRTNRTTRTTRTTRSNAGNRPPHYDAVIVGARAAGAATGMLLARAGRRVLIVDRSAYGADTLSTHALMRTAVLQLHRWGVLPRVIAAGTPAVRQVTFNIGDQRNTIALKEADGVGALYAPRRTVLDPILVDAARAAGAHVRFGTTVTGVRRDAHGTVRGILALDERGRSFDVDATMTVGADGMNSTVARWVGARHQRVGSAASAFAVGYFSGVADEGYRWFFRPGTSAGAIPTNDGQTCVFVGTTRERFRRELVGDPVPGFRALLRQAAPELGAELDGATAHGPLRRFPGRPGHLLQPFGAGWALVGDAGYYKDPISAHGLSDALRDAELLARAIIEATADGLGAIARTRALADYEATRNRLSFELFDTTDVVASYRWDAAEVGRLLLQLSAATNAEVDTLLSFDQTPHHTPRALAS